jgi:hypothetical protein
MTSYKELQSQIEKLQKEAELARKNELTNAIADIHAKMKEYNLSAAVPWHPSIAITPLVKPGVGAENRRNGWLAATKPNSAFRALECPNQLDRIAASGRLFYTARARIGPAYSTTSPLLPPGSLPDQAALAGSKGATAAPSKIRISVSKLWLSI